MVIVPVPKMAGAAARVCRADKEAGVIPLVVRMAVPAEAQVGDEAKVKIAEIKCGTYDGTIYTLLVKSF